MLRTILRQASFLTTLGLLALRPGVASAQLRGDSTWRAIQRLAGDAWSVWTSPAHARASDAVGAGAVIAATGVAAVLDEPVQH